MLIDLRPIHLVVSNNSKFLLGGDIIVLRTWEILFLKKDNPYYYYYSTCPNSQIAKILHFYLCIYLKL